MIESTAQKQLRFLALGDSYTIGEAVSESERWPMQFVSRINSSTVHFQSPEIIAKTGWTTDELQAAILEQNPQGVFDLVSLLIGVNNQYRGNSPEIYRKEFTQLLQQAIDFAGGNKNHVVVVSIPDWGSTPFAADRDMAAIATEIDLFNSINKEISLKMGVHYVDITVGSKEAIHSNELVATDGLHPSGIEYKRWATAVFQEMKNQY